MDARVALSELEEHSLVSVPVAARDATADPMRKGDRPRLRDDRSNGVEALAKPRAARGGAIVTKGHCSAPFPLSEHINDSRGPERRAVRRSTNVHGAGCRAILRSSDAPRQPRQASARVVGTSVRERGSNRGGEPSGVTPETVTLLSDGIHTAKKRRVEHAPSKCDAFDVGQEAQQCRRQGGGRRAVVEYPGGRRREVHRSPKHDTRGKRVEVRSHVGNGTTSIVTAKREDRTLPVHLKPDQYANVPEWRKHKRVERGATRARSTVEPPERLREQDNGFEVQIGGQEIAQRTHRHGRREERVVVACGDGTREQADRGGEVREDDGVELAHGVKLKGTWKLANVLGVVARALLEGPDRDTVKRHAKMAGNDGKVVVAQSKVTRVLRRRAQDKHPNDGSRCRVTGRSRRQNRRRQARRRWRPRSLAKRSSARNSTADGNRHRHVCCRGGNHGEGDGETRIVATQ